MKASYSRLSAVLFMAGLAGTITNVSVTVVTSPLAEAWDVPLSEAAVAVLGLNVAMAFTMPLAGLTAGRRGMRMMLLVGGFALLASTSVLLVAEGTLLLAIGRLGQGAAMAAITPTAVQASNTLLDRGRHSKALGWWSAANGAGLAMGPVMGGALFDLGGWDIVPIPTLVIAVLMIVVTLRAVPKGTRHEGRVRSFGAVMLSLMAGLAVLVLSAISVRAIFAAVAATAILLVVAGYAITGSRRKQLPTEWLRDLMVRRSGTGGSIQMFVNGMVQVAVPAWLVTVAITSSGAQARPSLR